MVWVVYGLICRAVLRPVLFVIGFLISLVGQVISMGKVI